MDNELYIIGTAANRDDMEIHSRALDAEGYSMNVLCPDTDGELLELAVDASNVVLWLSSDADHRLFEIGRERNARDLKTINVISDSTCLTNEQKSVVGLNQSIFLAITTDVSSELVRLIRSNVSLPRQASANLAHQVTTSQSSTVHHSTVEGGEVNVVTESSSLESSSPENSGIAPWKCLAIFVITFIVSICIEHEYHFSFHEWRTYILNGVCLFITMVGLGGIIGWRQHREKGFFSWMVQALGWLLFLYEAYSIIHDLYLVIFH